LIEAVGETVIVGFKAVGFVAIGTTKRTLRRAVSISPSTTGLKSINLKLKISFCGLLGFLSSGISDEQSHKEIRIAKKRKVESKFFIMVIDIYFGNLKN
jgi:hypothetical protein